MLTADLVQIGNRLLELRKKAGLTQSELAEAADIAERTYTYIERGEKNMRIDTLIALCNALRTTPNDILMNQEQPSEVSTEQLSAWLDTCSEKDRHILMNIISAYLNSAN